MCLLRVLKGVGGAGSSCVDGGRRTEDGYSTVQRTVLYIRDVTASTQARSGPTRARSEWEARAMRKMREDGEAMNKQGSRSDLYSLHTAFCSNL